MRREGRDGRKRLFGKAGEGRCDAREGDHVLGGQVRRGRLNRVREWGGQMGARYSRGKGACVLGQQVSAAGGVERFQGICALGGQVQGCAWHAMPFSSTDCQSTCTAQLITPK